MVWTYAGRSQLDIKVEKSSQFVNKLTRAESPAKSKRCSSELDIYSTHSTYT